MQIIPVIDLMDGAAVHAVAGKRDSYRPVKTVLAADATPAALAAGFVKLGLDVVYVADLDAIGGDEPNWQALNQIAAQGCRVMYDRGIVDEIEATEIVRFAAESPEVLSSIIVALETISGPDALEGVYDQLQPQQAVFSLDLRNGEPLSNLPGWQGFSPLDIASSAIDIGFSTLIVLDLAAVGMGQGLRDTELLSAIRQEFPQVTLFTGGGIHDLDDVRGVAKLGCDGLLLASALHEGTIGRRELETIC